MPTRTAEVEWKGNLARGSGTMSLGSGAFDGSYSFASRFEEGEGTNPEELIAAAHAGCFSMALAAALSKAGHEPESVRSTARVTLDAGGGNATITRSDLSTEVKVDRLSEEEFQRFADEAKSGCAVSRALGAIEIGLEAHMVSVPAG
jgi:lipoyl-dependent peroxiredoxin